MPKRVCNRCAMGHNCDPGPVCNKCQKFMAIYRRVFKIEAESFTEALLTIDRLYSFKNYPVSPRQREDGKWVFVYYGCEGCVGEARSHIETEHRPDGFDQCEI